MPLAVPLIGLGICLLIMLLINIADQSIPPCDKVAAPPNQAPITVERLSRADKNKQKYEKKWNHILGEAEKRRASQVVPGVEYKGALRWFVVERALATISPAEQLIVNELNKYHIKWHREVAFEGFMLTTYSHARYDFLLEIKGAILILEYDGKDWHQNEEQIARDKLKTKFCRDNKIPLIRYNAKHYYKMEEEIGALMDQYNIRKKIVA